MAKDWQETQAAALWEPEARDPISKEAAEEQDTELATQEQGLTDRPSAEDQEAQPEPEDLTQEAFDPTTQDQAHWDQTTESADRVDQAEQDSELAQQASAQITKVSEDQPTRQIFPGHQEHREHQGTTPTQVAAIPNSTGTMTTSQEDNDFDIFICKITPHYQ